MKHSFYPIIVILAIISFSLPAKLAVGQQVSQSESPVLCQPGVYLVDPQGCLPLGPSAYRTRLAQQGIVLPLIDLPAHPLDPSLSMLPYQYAVLGEDPSPVYPSLEDAIAGKNAYRTIEAGGLRYVSYINYADTENGRFFELRSGGWMRVSSRVSIPRSYPGGLEFSRTPLNTFGWILPLAATVETKRTPGYGTSDYTGHLINQYEVVQVYSTQVVDNIEWYLVGPDEWIEQRLIGRVIPNPIPPEGVTNGRWMEINLYEQTLSVYVNNQLVYATLIASGLDPFFTRPGLFSIYQKLETTPMMGAFEADRSDFYYLEDVPYTMYYDQLRALHGAYWRTAFGFPQSHGCINLAPADARWLYEWAVEGDWVYVWDPSGETPTDPNYYGEGGA
ncbi:MAG TPA: L,D-transpeptidase [Anaerolineales bacterium]|nr:L,D-transpeptidase [Anaerolineales bacterium]